MNLLIVFVLLCLFTCSASKAQDTTATALEEVIVKAYGNSSLQNTAAAISTVNRSAFERYAGTSAVNAINAIPGIIMEERSPGSYRINIRGSSLRSPFGVRNVKVYYNDIPFTEPGGTTYLNALGVQNFQSVEIIKGPGSSMYGAGTGGVMLIEGADTTTPDIFTASYLFGSYNLHNAYAVLNSKDHSVSYQHLQSDGFRNHSAMQRDVFSYTGRLLRNEKHQLRFSLLYTDLHYQTPGGLTLSEFNARPEQSRPATGTFPSASAARAAIHQNSFLSGIQYHAVVSTSLSQTSVLYFAYNKLKNPAIRNYGKNTEPHFGGRTHWKFLKRSGELSYQFDGGIEFQQNRNEVSVYTNINGEPGTLQTDDKVHTTQYFVFLQMQLTRKNWIATAGVSLNEMAVKFNPLFPSGRIQEAVSFSNGLAPRISLLRKLQHLTVYAAIEKGFSPPSASELLPSGSPLNLSLSAERGWNKQLGIRGTIAKHFYADVNVFSFSLKNTIVQRRDAGGGEYFINGGATNQYGIETYFNARLFTRSNSINRFMLWLSHTWHSFYYRNFKQINEDYSGNRLPGNAPHSVAAGFDLLFKNRFSVNATWYYTDEIFLNDANTATASGYHLPGVKVGYRFQLKKTTVQLFVGADNLLDETYSNGNDINAAGGRYYNVAAGRNHWVQLKIDLRKTTALPAIVGR